VREEPLVEPWNKLRAALRTAYDSIDRQRAEYRDGLWEITAVRLENAIEAGTAELEQLSSEDCTRRLEALTVARSSAEAILAEWDGIRLGAEASSALRLGTLLPICDNVREALVAQDALAALG